jgi:hypothetical protein
MSEFKITVAPAPLDATRQAVWPFGYPCGCNLEDGFCATHQPMVRLIHEAWFGSDSSPEVRVQLWALSDGYGAPGALPAQGYDWSGIRDSTPAAIERMAAVLEA